MSTIQLSELGALAEQVKRGETVEILDGEKTVARVVPIEPSPRMTNEERIDQLVREGKARRGTGKLPDWFFTRELPDAGGASLVEQLLEDRRSKDY
jgi:antitoxin (DNA-binding transcriptional repressor) of toxin-antitoxin stability system